MDDVRMPIETTREGNKITKVCVEDVYKIINRVQESLDKTYNNSIEVLESIHKEYNGIEGEIIIGTGISQPCLIDAFDEEIGNNIAFMKAKLNANLKKHNMLVRVYNYCLDNLDKLDQEIEKIDSNIRRDLEGVRKHNSEYLMGIEDKLGI